MWGFAIAKMNGGLPDIDTSTTPCHGWVHLKSAGNYGLYLFSGTAAQLSALNALPDVYGLCAMTDNGTVKWAELDTVVSLAIRTKLNQFCTARGWPNIPAGWTYRQILVALRQRLSLPDVWDINGDWVTD